MRASRRWSVAALVLVATATAAAGDERSPRGAPRPNVLFIAVDDLNDWVGCLGGHPQALTPNIDRLAARGVLFTNAHAAAPLCNPSRASVLTGFLPATSGVLGNDQDWRREPFLAGRPTLPEYFRRSGYWTGAAGKIYHANHGGETGALTGGHGGRRGFNHPASWVERHPSHDAQLPIPVVLAGQNWNGLDVWHWDWGPFDHPDVATVDGRDADWVIEQLRREHDRPFFLALGVYRPHGPWYCPRSYFDRHPIERVTLPVTLDGDVDDVPAAATRYLRNPNHFHARILERGLWRSAVQAYLANITFADAQVGRVIDALDRSEHRDDTIVVLWSDHGWHLGEKERWHKSTLWEEATRVPLIVVAPGVTEPGSRCSRPVSLVDLYPTLLDLCGLDPNPDNDGISLVPWLRDPSLPRRRPAVTSRRWWNGKHADHAVRSQRWRYIRYHDGSEELYDHHADPNEWTNVAADPRHAAVMAEQARWLPSRRRDDAQARGVQE